MNKQTVQFATVTENNAISKVGRSVITQPRTNFKGGSVKWHPDRMKQECSK